MRLHPTGKFDNAALPAEHIEVKPLAAAMGAEIRGVSIPAITDDQFAELRAALFRHKMIFLRAQRLTHAEQEAFSLRFGPFAEDAYTSGVPYLCQQLLGTLWDEASAHKTEITLGQVTQLIDRSTDRAAHNEHLTELFRMVSQSPAMLEITASRGAGIRTVQGDAVPLPFADGSFDRVLTGHFYGHLLPDERTAFLAEARRVAGDLVIVDSAERDGQPAEQWQERILNDGSSHRVYKRFFTGDRLAAELGGGTVLFDGRWFVAVSA